MMTMCSLGTFLMCAVMFAMQLPAVLAAAKSLWATVSGLFQKKA
jgi:hypothetical protein